MHNVPRLLFIGLLTLAGCGTEDNNATNNVVSVGSDAGQMDTGTTHGASDTGSVSDTGRTTDAGTVEDFGSADQGSQEMGIEPDLGEADLTARLIYINQRVFREDKFFAQGGIATVELIEPQELPADTRGEFFNEDGERCTFEMGTQWPEVAPDGSTWPEGPFLDGGPISLTAVSAPGPVVYDYFDTYYVRDSPGPVVIDNLTHSSFFPPEYIPHGAAAELSVAGGPGVAAFTVDGLSLASDYTVSAPDLETGNDVINTDAALQFTWDPPSPGDTMAVIVKDSFAFVKCRFEDDGSATVPAEAMALLVGGQFVRLTVQTWRERSVERKVQAADDTVVSVDFTSRHVQIGRFDSQ